MGIPVINLEELKGEKSSQTMSILHDACAKWGFFWIRLNRIVADKVVPEFDWETTISIWRQPDKSFEGIHKLKPETW
ncbi:hypothetical protein HPP92_023657 [Vanilla planifolia]|uniref:Non-haem dioxygenase N-terminal domain-containing protein n=1 Tax=Vanilla planifolia TaxID=51239 RepID=A0A835PM60_VANPL|nr:hypothetical protein HPP92_023657 [Vanilla planifolia]